MLMCVQCDVNLDTKLWELARTIAQQTKSMIDRQVQCILYKCHMYVT